MIKARNNKTIKNRVVVIRVWDGNSTSLQIEDIVMMVVKPINIEEAKNSI